MKYLLVKLFCLLAITCLFSSSVIAQSSSADAADYNALQAAGAEINYLRAPIKNTTDLSAYMRVNEVLNTPLSYMTKANREIFLDSLKFSDSGLAGFNFRSLRGLTVTQAYNILSLFGFQHYAGALSGTVSETKLDFAIKNGPEPEFGKENFECVNQGTCGPAVGFICTSNC